MAPHTILVGSYTTAVTTLVFDPAADPPALAVASSLEVGHHPSWLSRIPASAGADTLVFTGLEQAEGKVVALRFDGAGQGKVVGEVDSGGKDPCTHDFHDGQLLVGNYSSGTVATLTHTSSSPFIASPTAEGAASVLQLEGTGPDKSRQESSHPHQIYFHGDELLVPDLGADKTWRLKKVSTAPGSSRTWTVQGSVAYAPGGGPRHVVVHDGILYTVLELTSQLSAHAFPALPEAPAHLATVSTLTAAPAPGMLAAEILLGPTSAAFPAPYLYVSNRNDPHAGGDTIAIFAVDKIREGTLALVQEVRTGLTHLRGMAFGGAGGEYLIAGGAQGGGVKVFQRVDEGKGLKEVATIDLEAPTAFLWL